MRHIFIGDVHGCIDELKSLIKEIDLQIGDVLYFLGDLIDRGPDSVGVVRYVFELSKKYDTKLIVGNHEEKFFRYLNHIKNKPKLLLEMIGIDEFEYLNNNLNTEEKCFIQNAYFNLNIPELGILLVHGGVPKIELLESDINYKYQYPTPKALQKISLLTKTRYLDENGVFVSSNQLTASSYFWAERYPKRYKFVIFGHTPFIQNTAKYFYNAMGIDTGCVYGGWLTAAICSEKNKYKTVSVKAKSVYFQSTDSII